MNIKSPAIEILQPYEKNFKSVEDIYTILKTQFQVSDKFKKLDNLKQIGSGEESIQLLAVKIQALVDSVCTKETRESCALKYFVNALRPDVFKRVSQLCPVNIENAIIQAKMVEEELAKTSSKKEPVLKEVKLAQISHESISNKNYEAIKQQLAALSNVVNSNQQQRHSSSYQPRNQSNQSNRSPIKCFHCKKIGHSFRKCFKASKEDVNRISKELDEKQKQNYGNKFSNNNNLNLQCVEKTVSPSHDQH
jgi:hypothetical protein